MLSNGRLDFPVQVFIYRKFEDVFKWEDLELNISNFGRSPIAPVQVLGHAHPLDACPNMVAFWGGGRICGETLDHRQKFFVSKAWPSPVTIAFVV